MVIPMRRRRNLDRLAADGVIFDAAYAASPLCCPSRAALATGRYPHQTGYWDNAITYDGRMTSWMRRLRDQGHEVVSIGKLHFRATEDDNGFSEELLPMHILGGKGGVHMLLRGFDDEHVNKGQFELYMERSGVGTAPYQPYDRDITESALDWLTDRSRRTGKPFVLFVSYPSPHPPFSVPATSTGGSTRRVSGCPPPGGRKSAASIRRTGICGTSWGPGRSPTRRKCGAFRRGIWG